MRLDGVMIWVQDVPATVDFYQRAFGLDVQVVDEHGRFAMTDTGATTLQFASEDAAVEVEPAAASWGQTLGNPRDLNGCLVGLNSPAAP